MQKKIIALAIASAMTVPAMAYAEVSISGQANVSIDRVNSGNASPNDTTVNQLSSNNSRIILKASEDLGNGMSAIVFIDHRFSLDTGAAGATFWGGNAYLGLKSNDFGTVMAGRIDTPYKSSTRNLDVFFDVAGDNRSSNGTNNPGLMSAHDVRLNNVLAYTSPSMGGFSVAAATVFGAETPVAAPNDKKGTAISLAGMFTMDNIYATLAYQSLKAGSAGTGDLGAGGTLIAGAVDDKATALKLGGGFSMDAFTVNAVIERPTSKVAATGVDTSNTNVYLGGKFALGSADSVRAAFTKRGATSGASNDAKQYAIGYVHDMSKTTSVYATYVKTTDNTLNAADPSVLSFGMKHAF